MSKKEPRAQKSKEQLLAELRNNAQFQKKMKFTREVFYPALHEASTSVDDAVMLLSGFNTAIMQEFLGLMKVKTVKDLDLSSKLDVKAEKAPEMKKLLELFNDMSVFEAKDLIEGMRNEINLFQSEFWKERRLNDLPAKWIDQI